MSAKIISLVIGYLCGCFLTAEIVARFFSGKSASEIGDTGNPGMANIMAGLGFIPGILTLAGDLGKCMIAGFLSFHLFRNEGRIIMLYAGLGCTLGHDFPLWRHFRGGKGVAVTSMAIVLFSFWEGLAANITGMLTVFATKYLCVGGPVIPAVFFMIMFIQKEWEASVLGIILTLLSVWSHGPSILGIYKGKTKRTDVLAAIRNKVLKGN